MGRHSKLTQASLNAIAAHLGEGCLDRDFAHLCGVCRDTFGDWKRKGKKAKGGIYFKLNLLLEQDVVMLDERIQKPWMKKVDEGDSKAIEMALKKHPRLRAEFKEEPTEIKGEHKVTTDVISSRVDEYFTELQKRGLVSGSEILRDNSTKPLHPRNTHPSTSETTEK